MAEPPVLRTRRGLALAFYGDIAALVAIVGFLLARRATILVAGFALAGLFALPSLRAVWRGRSEFGPVQVRNGRWGMALFVVGAAAYALTLLALTTTFPTEGRLATLRIGLFLLAVALVAETASGWAFLWALADARARRLLGLQALLTVLFVVGFLVHGLSVVNDFVRRSGGVAVNPAEAASYLHDFVRTSLVDFALAFFVARLPGLVALWRVISRLAAAEATAATEPDEAPATP